MSQKEWVFMNWESKFIVHELEGKYVVGGNNKGKIIEAQVFCDKVAAIKFCLNKLGYLAQSDKLTEGAPV